MQLEYIYADWENWKAYIVAQNGDMINVAEWRLEMWDDCFVIKHSWRSTDLPLKWMYNENKFSVVNIAKSVFDDEEKTSES